MRECHQFGHHRFQRAELFRKSRHHRCVDDVLLARFVPCVHLQGEQDADHDECDLTGGMDQVSREAVLLEESLADGVEDAGHS